MTKPETRLIHAEALDDIVNYVVYRCARLLRQKFQRDMKLAGLALTQEQYFLLFKLWARDGQYQAELTDDLFADAPNITRILDGMARKRLIQRRPDALDRRKIRVHLAAEGRRVHELYRNHAPRSRADDYRNVGDEDLATLRRILRTIEANITQQLWPGRATSPAAPCVRVPATSRPRRIRRTR